MSDTTNLDPAALASVKEEIAKKELQQKRHYFLQNELQNMARELPGKYQQRMPYNLLSGLASALLDETVFEIVRSLQEVQQLEERHLSSQRIRMINDHKAQRHELQKKHKELLLACQSKPHNLPLVEVQIEREKQMFNSYMKILLSAMLNLQWWKKSLIEFKIQTLERRCDEEVKKRDMKIIMELDQKVMDQQVMLERAGVPGFFVTNGRQEIQLQMYLLEFIQRLSHMELPS